MPKFPVPPLDDESYRMLMVKLSASGRINYSEVNILIAYIEKLKAGKGK